MMGGGEAYHAAICLVNALLGALGNALICAVFGFEVDYGCPVVAFTTSVSCAQRVLRVAWLTEVLGHLAGRTGRLLDEIVAVLRIHGDIERVLFCVRHDGLEELVGESLLHL